jgi:putative membrane protein
VDELFIGLAQLAVAIILSAIAAYLAYAVLTWFSRDLDEEDALRKGNVAVGLVLGSCVVAVAIMLRPTLVVDTAAWDVGSPLVVKVLLAQALQLVIGLVMAVIALVLALFLFSSLTRRIDEIAQLKDGNLAVAALLSGVVIAVGLLISQALDQIVRLVSSTLF